MSISVLQRATSADVVSDPFPYLVIENALPQELYDELARTLPTREQMGIAEARSNTRWNYPARHAVANEALTPLWRDFIAYHSGEGFFREIVALFHGQIARLYPSRFADRSTLDAMRVGMREVEDFATHQALLEAMVAGNTPVATPSSVRTTHVDLGDKLFSGLFYMRLPEDDSTGGDLTISRFKAPFRGRPSRYDLFKGAYVDDKHVEHVKTVKYGANKLVLFINSLDSLHGVTVRAPTHHPRLFVNLVGEIDPPLYHIVKNKPARYAADVEAPPGLLSRWIGGLTRKLAS